MQNAVAITQSSHSLTVEQMRIDSRDLWRYIRTQPERAPGQLIDQLECLQIELATGARQQRFEMLEQRRHHQLETVAAGHVEQPSTQFFDVPGLGRQDIGDVLGQQPSR